MYFKNKTKLIYNTNPPQFWCKTCGKSINIVYIDRCKRYCPYCFNGKEEEYEVVKEFEKGGWIKNEK